jgi:hypothetical protein
VFGDGKPAAKFIYIQVVPRVPMEHTIEYYCRPRIILRWRKSHRVYKWSQIVDQLHLLRNYFWASNSGTEGLPLSVRALNGVTVLEGMRALL